MLISNRWCTSIENLISKELCEELIFKLDTGEKLEKVVRADLATYDRNILINEDLANQLYKVIQPLLPPSPPTTGCNEYFRFSKYHSGEEFKQHRDGINQDKRGHRAKYTVNIFLNDNFEGGSTEFFDEARKSQFIAEPLTGRGMIFDNQMIHCGNKVLSGYKYLIRTDVMVSGME
jgi:prolyl 4-hydroxylase